MTLMETRIPDDIKLPVEIRFFRVSSVVIHEHFVSFFMLYVTCSILLNYFYFTQINKNSSSILLTALTPTCTLI